VYIHYYQAASVWEGDFVCVCTRLRAKPEPVASPHYCSLIVASARWCRLNKVQVCVFTVHRATKQSRRNGWVVGKAQGNETAFGEGVGGLEPVSPCLEGGLSCSMH